MKYSTPRSSSDRIASGFSRTTIDQVDDSHLMQQVNLSGFAGESQQNIENPHEYGFASHVQPPTQGDTGSNSRAESFVAFAGGNRSHGVALLTGDRRYRMMNMQPGEVALHDDQSQQIHLSRGGIVHTALNSQTHTHNIMPANTSALNSQQNQGQVQGDPTKQNGQTPWITLISNGNTAPFSFHSIDKKTRTTQHPGTVIHQISDPKDAANGQISSAKKKIVHFHYLDQANGHLVSVANGQHTRSTHPTNGIKDSVSGGQHVHVINSSGFLAQTTQSILHSAAQSITHTSQSIIHNGNQTNNGNTQNNGTLNVSQLLSVGGGISSGALEVASDANGGLVQCTLGLAVNAGANVVGGLSTDTISVSGKISLSLSNFANDSTAATGGIAVGQLYRTGSAVMIRVT